jgi:hypothetical protein
MPLPSQKPGSSHLPVISSRASRLSRMGRPTTSTGLEPGLSIFLEIMMIVTLVAVMYGWHKIAHIIVMEYGLLGSAITCGVLYVVALIMERRDTRRHHSL